MKSCSIMYCSSLAKTILTCSQIQNLQRNLPVSSPWWSSRHRLGLVTRNAWIVDCLETVLLDRIETRLFQGRLFLQEPVDVMKRICRHVQLVHEMCQELITDAAPEWYFAKYTIKGLGKVEEQKASRKSTSPACEQLCKRLWSGALQVEQGCLFCLPSVDGGRTFHTKVQFFVV